MQTDSSNKPSEKLTSKPTAQVIEMKELLDELKDDDNALKLISNLLRAYKSKNKMRIDLAIYAISNDYIEQYKQQSEAVQDYLKETYKKHVAVVKKLGARKPSYYQNQ